MSSSKDKLLYFGLKAEIESNFAIDTSNKYKEINITHLINN